MEVRVGIYDIVAGETQVVRSPDIVIVEGLNVLQSASSRVGTGDSPPIFVSDFFDFSIYVDAEERTSSSGSWSGSKPCGRRSSAIRTRTSIASRR